MPLTHVRARKLIRYETGNGWCRIVAEGRVTARVVHPPDAFLCRVGAPPGNDVVQLSIGRVRSLIADSLFSPKKDLGLQFSGKNLRLEWKRSLKCYVVSCRDSLTIHVKENLYSGRYMLDPTSAKTHRYLRRLFTMLCREWGYHYVKIDAQGYMVATFTKYRDRFAKRRTPPDEAYRDMLQSAKRAMGKKRFLLNCGAGWDSPGLCEGIRIGGDVRADVSGIESAVDCTMSNLFLNNIAWWTDPDVVCVRPPLTLEQARTWATFIAITGQLLMASDEMAKLPDSRVELLRRVMPVTDIRPMELYRLKNRPCIFDLKINKPGVGEWDVVAVFNWSRRWRSTGTVSVESLGIPPCKAGFIFHDVWRESVLAIGRNDVRVSIPPMSCRLVSVRARKDRPQLVGTSRHITQGADDLERVSWSGAKRVLSGRSRLVGGDPYRIRFTVPKGWKVLTNGVTVKGAIGLFTLESGGNSTVNWSLKFAKKR